MKSVTEVNSVRVGARAIPLLGDAPLFPRPIPHVPGWETGRLTEDSKRKSDISPEAKYPFRLCSTGRLWRCDLIPALWTTDESRFEAAIDSDPWQASTVKLMKAQLFPSDSAKLMLVPLLRE